MIKYLNANHHRLMSMEANRKFPKPKYHNYRGKLGLRYHIAIILDVFLKLKAAVSLATDAWLNLTMDR